MGLEAKCKLHHQGKILAGKALLETDFLAFRGELKLTIPFKMITSIRATEGRLKVVFAREVAVFDLGQQATKWAERILHPKSLIDKLGVKPNQTAIVVGITDRKFLRQLKERTPNVSHGRLRKRADHIFFDAETKGDLRRLKPLEKFIAQDGAIWVVAPKGRPQIKESDVLQAGRAADLLDVKVVAFSATHTAHKFVIPRVRL